jgi:Subtilase family/Secretion system C-terminal sorting domain
MRKLLLLLLTVLLLTDVFGQQPQSRAENKLSPVLKDETKRLPRNEERIYWLVVSHIDSTQQLLQQNNIPATDSREYQGIHLVSVRTTRQVIDSLILPRSFIRFVDVQRIPKEELALGYFDNAVNTINRVHRLFPLIDGSSMVASIKENKPDTTDIDLTGRYLSTNLSSATITTHATIMATTLAGAGNSFYTGTGAAPAATFSSSDFATLLPDADALYKQYGISVQNHSYGTGIENYYGADAVAYDASVIINPALLHVFSSGNSGDQASTTGNYSGIAALANLTGSFKMAKNIITVGAVDSFNTVAFLSSKGPAYDGRIKPELVAFGEDGSSGAAAITSGAALLVQQAYKQLHGAQLPPASLVKAVLLNSAKDIGTKGPDYATGFGSLDAYKAVQTILSSHFYIDSITQGQIQLFPLTIPANIRVVKITLCWSDVAAAVNAPVALVNDLDLQLLNTSSVEKWLPWVLNSTAIKDSLLLPAVRRRDSLNTVEQVSIDNPAAGNYIIQVAGRSQPGGEQVYSIAYQLDSADHFAWSYPLATDNLVSNSRNVLRWSSTFTGANGKLEYSLNKGATWQLLNNSADLTSEYINWQTPDTFCTVILRMTINGQVFESDTSTISAPVAVNVGFNCIDSLLMYWNRIPAASAYQLYRLNGNYMQPLLVVTDTSIIIKHPQQASAFYSVAPVLNAGKTGIRSYTFDYALQGVGCYIKNFLADLTTNNTAQVTIELGTLYAIKSISVEKMGPNGFTILQTIQLLTGLTYQVIDAQLTRGINTYRPRIELQDGSILYSQSQFVYYFSDSRYLVFPNPLRSKGTLNIVATDPFNNQLLIYNTYGQLVFERMLNNTTETISLQHLKAGLYVVMIRKEGRVDFRGKIVIE